jgi:hypothetical protein
MAALWATSANLVTALTAAAPGPFGSFVISGGTATVNSAGGPAGNNTITFVSNASGSTAYGIFPSSVVSPYGCAVGFAFQYTTAPTNTSTIFEFVGTSLTCKLNLTNTGVLQFVDAGGTVTGGGILSSGVRHYVEIVPLAFTTGQQVYVYVDGNYVSPYISLNTANLNVGYPVTPWIGAIAGSATTALNWVCDSIYHCDSSGGNNYLLALGTSTVVVDGISAGVGQFTNYAPNGAATVWQCLNTIPPPGDTTYASDATAGDQAAVSIGAISSLGSVAFINVEANVRQEVSSGGRSFAVGIGNGSAVTYGSTRTPTTTYQVYNQVFDGNPNVGGRWLVSQLPTLQPAIETIS